MLLDFQACLYLAFAVNDDPSLVLFMQLAIAKNNIIKLQEENQHLRSENSLILLKTQQQFEVHACIVASIYISYSKNRLVTVCEYKCKEIMWLQFFYVRPGDSG